MKKTSQEIEKRLELCAQRIKELRTSNDMTLKEFAKAVGSSPSAIQRYEAGERIPTINLVSDIAERFNVSVGWLAGGDTKVSGEKELLLHFRGLSEDGKRVALKYLDFLFESEKKGE